MHFSRRNFLINIAGASTAFAINIKKSNALAESKNTDLDKIIETPLLRKYLFSESVIIEDLKLLRYENNFICVVTAKNGAKGLSISNNAQMKSLFPIFTNRLQPFFIGKDAVELDQLLEEVYVYKSNYKLQNLALWVPLATIEFAILDLLGKIAGKPMASLLGDRENEKIAVYQANNYRGETAEDSIIKIKEHVEKSGAKAVKFKVGGRMSKNRDHPPGRTEKLIPLVRKAFGEDMTIYADSNGSYDVTEAVRVGQIMEEYKFDFFEEPVPFDWYEETKAVTDQINIPVAGGEQEPSMHQFKWLVKNDALDIVQPDIFYFGGMIRSLKVALMAQTKGKTCVPHISGSGLGYLYMMHFVSILPNAGPYHEFKGFNKSIPLECATSDLKSHNGKILVPSGPGLGVEIDPDYIAKHVEVT